MDNTDTAIDGIAELWFESEDAQRIAYQSAEYQAVVEDEPNLFTMDSYHIHPVMTRKTVRVIE